MGFKLRFEDFDPTALMSDLKQKPTALNGNNPPYGNEENANVLAMQCNPKILKGATRHKDWKTPADTNRAAHYHRPILQETQEVMTQTFWFYLL